MDERSDAGRRQRPAPFGFRESAPDSIRFPYLEGIGTAFADNRTDLAHSLGSHLSALSLILAFLSVWGEEKVGVVAATEGDRLPGTIG